jgi:hypothetical protein
MKCSCVIVPAIAFALYGVAAVASASADTMGPLGGALSQTKLLLDTRIRYEGVDQDPMAEDAEAVTLRTRVGFETGKAWGTSLLAEGDLIWPLVDDYNSTTNGETQYPIVADPETYEINRLQLTNTSLGGTTITLGRQRIVLDDHRFVGNVGWRQNEQTYDSLRILNKSIENLTLDLAYVNQVNRVFGKESPQGHYEGDSVLANVSYQLPIGKLTGFGYLLEFDPIAAVPAAVRDSSETLGVRFAGERPINASWKLAYAASYGTQSERGDNPLSFDLEYYLAELTANVSRYSFGAGVEVLEGDGVKGFTTPLATLHKFQGWTDRFLATPAEGIEDKYINAGMTLKNVATLEALSLLAVYHTYEAERVSMDFGTELNLQLQAKLGKFNGVLKYGDYQSEGFSTDTKKYWVQFEYVW